MKKKVVILSAFLTPFRSGAEACAEEVPLALADQFDFVIITTRLRRNLPKHDKLQGKIPVVRVGFGYSFDKWLYPFLAAWEVRKHKPDVVHAILETFAGLALVFCRWTTSAKRILTCQTTNRSFLKGMIVRSPDRVTVISKALQKTVSHLGRKDAVVIPNGINLSAIQKAYAEHPKVPGRILFVGRLEIMKGVDTLLHAFGRLVETPHGASLRNNIHLRIVGDGSQLGTLEQLARDLKVSDRVAFVGRVSPDRVAAEYAQAEIFCGLSRSEALGNVFLEAQAAGCGVIGTNVGGIPDVIEDGQTGLLVPPADIGASANAMKKLLEDPELRRRLGDAAQKNAERYDWSSIAKEYAKLY